MLEGTIGVEGRQRRRTMSYGCGNHPLDGGFLRLSDAEVMSGECRSCNGGHFLRGQCMSTRTAGLRDLKARRVRRLPKAHGRARH